MYPGRYLSPVDYRWKDNPGDCERDPRYSIFDSIIEYDLYQINGALRYMY